MDFLISKKFHKSEALDIDPKELKSLANQLIYQISDLIRDRAVFDEDDR